MRKLILKMELSLDGYAEDSEGGSAWPLDSYDDELTADCVSFLGAAGLHVIGRGAYEDMEPHWPTSESPFAKPMNEIPKVVFSSTLQETPWEARVHRGDAVEEIQRLKRETGGPIVVHGGMRFVRSLSHAGLIDEYRLHIHPIALGQGRPLFEDRLELRLAHARAYPGGALVTTYTAR